MTKTKIATASFDDNGNRKMSYIDFDPNGKGGGWPQFLSTVFANAAEQQAKQKTVEPQAQQLAIPLNYPNKGKTYKLNIELELPIYAKDVPATIVAELAEYLASYITDVAVYGEGLGEDDIMGAIGLVFDANDELEQRLSEAQRYR